jgi:hypothetical protein
MEVDTHNHILEMLAHNDSGMVVNTTDPQTLKIMWMTPRPRGVPGWQVYIRKYPNVEV